MHVLRARAPIKDAADELADDGNNAEPVRDQQKKKKKKKKEQASARATSNDAVEFN